MKKLLISLMLPLLLCSCTLSFQNIDTHGTASDLVDDTLSTTPNVSPNINVPVSVAPASTGK
jgi:hypothetical protein